jgi:hypothetical protein
MCIDPNITWLLDHHEIHLLLHANPDGRKQAESGKYWRKKQTKIIALLHLIIGG